MDNNLLLDRQMKEGEWKYISTHPLFVISLLAVIHVEFHHRLDALAEHVEREAFVGRVDGIRFEAEAH